jgi:glycosyltransferase involved in cell wall biosynthesis
LKKILIFHHFGGLGGAGLSLLHILKSIDVNMYNVKVVCPKTPNDMVKAIKALNIEVIETDGTPKLFAHYNGGIKYFFSIRTFLNAFDILCDYPKVKKIIENELPDLIFVNSMTLFWIGKITCKKNIPSVCFHRESFQRGLIGLRTSIIKKGLSKYFNRVVFISRFDMNNAGGKKENQLLIYDKVEGLLYDQISKHTAQYKLNLDPNYKYLLYLGGFSKLKGSENVVNCMQYLKDLNIKLLFIGAKTNIKNYRGIRYIGLQKNYRKVFKLIENYDLKNNIIFLETTSEPHIYYKASDAIIFPSTKAHQARPIYEAGFAKIPIIITDFEETREFAKNEINVLTFECNNSKSLSDKIRQIFSNEELYQKLEENNHSISVSNHNLETLKSELQSLINSVFR